jgi:hypothetical protein
MLINTHLPLAPESNAADLQNSRAAAAASTPADSTLAAADPAAELDSASSRLLGLSEQEGDLQDGAAADQAANYLRSSMFSQPGMIFAAQAHLNPQTVFNLLQ